MGVYVEHVGRVAVATIDRQEVRNALDLDGLDALASVIDDPGGARAVVIIGAGSQSFCSGLDLKVLATFERADVSAVIARFDAAIDAVDRCPVVAALNGPATGGGFEIALRCDLVVAAEHAHVRLPEVSHGLVPGGGAVLLPARIPLAVALELALTGEPMPVQRAYALGLVNEVVGATAVLDAALGLAERIAANAPRAVRVTRALMRQTVLEGPLAAQAASAAAQQDPRLQAEMDEGVAAFLQKRPPRW